MQNYDPLNRTFTFIHFVDSCKWLTNE